MQINILRVYLDNPLHCLNPIRNLGTVFDPLFSFEDYINKQVKAANFNLYNINKIRSLLTTETCTTLVRSTVLPIIDYCNALLIFLPDVSTRKLHMLQRSAVRVIFNLPRRSNDSISNLMKQLHWLPFRFRVKYKILLLTHNAYHHNSPLYLANCIETKTIPRSARPAVTNLLKTPYHNRNHGLRAFSCAAPTLWNKLPPSLREQRCTNSFKRALKMYLFKIAYDQL